MNTIETVIKKQYKHMSKNAWIAGMSSFIVGLFAHLFILTNEFANHDDVAALWERDWSLNNYRWLQSLCGPLVSMWGSGLMAGILTLIILSISAVILVDTMKIESKALSAVVGAMMSSCTIVACFMSYPNGSFLFVVGIPFALLALRWYDKGIKGFIAASLAIMFAIAGYQSNICITVACIYVQLFCVLLSKDVDIKKWWIRFGKAFAMLICGLILFVISTKVTGAINGNSGLSLGITSSNLEAYGYAGQAESGNLYLTEIVGSVVVAVKYFIKYEFNLFFGGPNKSFASVLICGSNIVATLLLIYSVVVALIKQKGIFRKIMIFLVACAAPICINSTEIILNGKCHETLQMMYSMTIAIVWFVCVVEKSELVKENTRILFTNILFFALVANLYGNIQIDNDAYQRMNSAYETAYSEMTRIIYRVELLPEWQDGCRTLYFDFGENGGYLINENYQAMRAADDYIDMGWMGVFGTGVYNFWGNNNASKFVKCYLGLEFDAPSEEQIEAIKNSPEYDELEKYPSTNAIKVIDGVVVIRLDE